MFPIDCDVRVRMPIRFSCTKCSKKLSAPDKLAGKLAKCPDCGTKTRIPAPSKQKVAVARGDDPGFEIVEEAQPDAPEKAKKTDKKAAKPTKATRPCPECEEMIPEKAVVCRFCGAKFDLATKDEKMRAEDAARKKKRQGGNGAILALLLIVIIAAAGGVAYMFLM